MMGIMNIKTVEFGGYDSALAKNEWLESGKKMVRLEGPTSVESGRWIGSPGYQLLHDGVNTNWSSIMFIMVFVLSTLFLSKKKFSIFFLKKKT